MKASLLVSSVGLVFFFLSKVNSQVLGIGGKGTPHFQIQGRGTPSLFGFLGGGVEFFALEEERGPSLDNACCLAAVLDSLPPGGSGTKGIGNDSSLGSWSVTLSCHFQCTYSCDMCRHIEPD